MFLEVANSLDRLYGAADVSNIFLAARCTMHIERYVEEVWETSVKTLRSH